MAVIVGESGAWKGIAAQLALRGYSVAAPSDLLPLLTNLETTRPQVIEASRFHTLQAAQVLTDRIAAIARRRMFFRLVGWFQTRALRMRLDALRAADANCAAAIDQAIAHVRSILGSAELAGAQAEVAVIARLRTLPPPAVVFNDVRLRATRFMRFDGVPLQSAQIDHVVLTPGGIFVVETKRWTARFVASGAFHNPFDQVRRANYLCHSLLRASIGKTRVRSIIATDGQLPEAPSDSYVKVLRLDGLAGYIAGFRSAELSPSQFNRAREFFERQTGGSDSA